jgi:tripartite-type tricarboxylate transporter receptor subunit TctC
MALHRTCLSTLAALLGCSLTASAAESEYPTRPVRMIVAFAPGGGSDTAARILAQRLSSSLGQQVVIDNRPGASGNLGHDIGARSTPDGYTLMWTSIGPIAVNPSLFRKLPYDPIRDFDPITLTADSLNALVVHPSVPAQSVKELIALARSQPGKLSYGSSGIGGAGHLAGELFNLMAGVDLVHIPYKGGGPAMVDLLGGQIQAIFATLVTALPHIKSGKIRALGVTPAKRAPMLPDVPTIAEAGLPGYEAANWYGLLAPARTPKPIISRLNREVVRILETQEVRDAYFGVGMLAQTSTPETFGAYLKKEIAKWNEVIRKTGIRAE